MSSGRSAAARMVALSGSNQSSREGSSASATNTVGVRPSTCEEWTRGPETPRRSSSRATEPPPADATSANAVVQRTATTIETTARCGATARPGAVSSASASDAMSV